MSKTSGKREKLACASMGHLAKLKNIKNGGWREWRRREVGLHEGEDLILVVPSPLATSIYKNIILPLRITKMLLLDL